MSLNLGNQEDRPAKELLFIGANQDNSCVAVGTTKGFSIFVTDPYKRTVKRDVGGIGCVAMLYRCNILALVGGGDNPKFGSNKLILWDDIRNQPIGELPFKSEIKNVKIAKKTIAVVLENHIFLYDFQSLVKKAKLPTCKNPLGLVALAPTEDLNVAYPTEKLGEVCVHTDTNQNLTIQAHESSIGCMSINNNGTKLATASLKGTLIRIWDTDSGQKLHELRRGTERALIYSISFNTSSNLICTSSDKGTIHVFSIEKDPANTSVSVNNRKSKMKFLGGYFNSDWSFATFKGPQTPSICCFGREDNTIIIMTAEGYFYRVKFDAKKGGTCKQEKFIRFYSPSKE
mmetsp:Transcript_2473/g.3594  ORF Transcript_2473/g.3594 Transcript_2473/m.3594 type:complete len:344 (+) Transcript_2473:29-1060(+)